ncbi:hypothetical protein GECvBMG_gp221c [Salmonella phage GEC_vB_MG]|nr:hypothetical protein GECvBMG_gp221c [Salmonella phage GEC_vB_MG]
MILLLNHTMIRYLARSPLVVYAVILIISIRPVFLRQKWNQCHKNI